MSDAMLKAHHLHKNYMAGRKEVKAVNGVSLEIRKGASIAIVGPSGAGKSTLLHLLGGLDAPSAGSVTLDGIDMYELSDVERARIRNRKIGFVFQFYHLLPEFTALENIMIPALIKSRAAGSPDRERLKDNAQRLLRSVGLSNRAHHRPGELSGGESQRIAIARALVNEPEILLCDEPTGNLDSVSRDSIYELLFDFKTNTNMALVIVTHDESMSSRVDETIRIKDGKAT